MLYIAVAVLGVVLDQLSKHWASTTLKNMDTIPIIDGVFHLTYAENRGSAFSMFEGMGMIVVGIAVIMTAVLIYFVIKKHVYGAVGLWATALVISGAIGNSIDRLRLEYVVDMFDFRLINFAIFNVADICLSIGTGLMIIFIIFIDPKHQKKLKEQSGEANDKSE